jgi:hypothetical protein
VNEVPSFNPIENYQQFFNEAISKLPTSTSIDQQITESGYYITYEINQFPIPKIYQSHNIFDIIDPEKQQRRVIIYHTPDFCEDYTFGPIGCMKAKNIVFSEDHSMEENIEIDPNRGDIVKYSKKFSYPSGSTEEKIDISTPFAFHTVAYKNQLGELIREDKLPL